METVIEPRPHYAGEVRHVIDDKNRLTIPKAWRKIGGSDFFMFPRADRQCLRIMTPAEFSRMIAKAEAATDLTTAQIGAYLRFMHASAQQASADTQGRMVLPENFCSQLDLRGEVVLSGNHGLFEVWNGPEWDRVMGHDKPLYREAAGKLEY
ncbi:MAG: division/cell wall cluster transcriptional repressor MraZ [Chthoniobacterales bacterium]